MTVQYVLSRKYIPNSPISQIVFDLSVKLTYRLECNKDQLLHRKYFVSEKEKELLILEIIVTFHSVGSTRLFSFEYPSTNY
jgi:hypothetical protein